MHSEGHQYSGMATGSEEGLQIHLVLERDTWHLGERVSGRVIVESEGPRSMGQVALRYGCTAIGAPRELAEGRVIDTCSERLFRDGRVLAKELELEKSVELPFEVEKDRQH